MNIQPILYLSSLCFFGGFMSQIHAQDNSPHYIAEKDIVTFVEEQTPSEQKGRSVIERCLKGDVKLGNTQIVQSGQSPKIHDYAGSLTLKQNAILNKANDPYHQPACCALLTLVSDDGCNVSINGSIWLQEVGQGSGISKSERNYGSMLFPGSHKMTVRYSQSYYDPKDGEKDLDGISLIVSTIPVDIRVSGSKDNLLNDEKTLIVKGETIYMTLAPEWKDIPNMYQDRIKWEQRKLLGSGSKEAFSAWTPLGGQATGTRCSHVWQNPGIYQIRAVIDGKPFTYLRKEDVAHRFDSSGESENVDLRKGYANYVGVAHSLKEKQFTLKAQQSLGSTLWAWKAVFPEGYDYSFFPNNGVGAPKCNIFVYCMSFQTGIPLQLISERLGTRKRPPICKEYTDNTFTIIRSYNNQTITWKYANGSRDPSPGFIITDGSHCGIINYDGTWINAGSITVNVYIHIKNKESDNPFTYRTLIIN